ncbi:MAG: hypothetical protein NC483_00505 [Ruminococcus sp.]|nr:hypothetical protein [Ruminococcus sp.]
MASKKLQGITIEIDGSTTKLNDALKNTNKVIYSTNSELKSLNQALKLDPKNTELLAQKQELLKKNISESTDRLNALKEAQRQMGSYNSLTDEQKENYRALSVEITKSENAIQKMNSELKKTNSIDLSKVGDVLKKVGDIATEVIKKVAQVVVAVSTALAGVVAAGVKSYADLEQNIGGVETLFGDSAQKVIDNANKAYETAGVSANEYMEGITSFTASLLQSLGGDTSKAADVADMAFQDMSDNANKFGTDMSSIQNAYQGFAKQNYTMLDNLKLGYGGTKTEMERLLVDAEKFSGVKYDINNLSDVYNAIHVIQEELDVTGTTAKEAATTISGSATSMKAAFNNFLNGSGSSKQLAKTIKNFVTNVTNAITDLAPNILTGITELIETLLPQLGDMLMNLLPQLFTAVQNMLNSLFTMISTNIQPIANLVVNLLTSFVNFILQNLPMIIQIGLQLITALATGIANNLPELIPTIVDVILQIVTILLDNLDLLIEAAIQIIVALTVGIMNALPDLLAKVPEIIIGIYSVLINLLPQILSAGLRIIAEIGLGIIRGIPDLVSKIPQVITSITGALKKGLSSMADVGKNLVKGLWNGISSSLDWIKDKIKGWVGNVMDFIKKLFGINSPSKVMRDQVGVYLAEGIGVGFEKGMKGVNDTIENALPTLSSKVSFNAGENLVSRGTGVSNVNNYETNNFNIYSPKDSPAEYARQVRNELQYMKLANR